MIAREIVAEIIERARATVDARYETALREAWEACEHRRRARNKRKAGDRARKR